MSEQHHPTTRNCPHCGNRFDPAVWNQKFCSRECWLTANHDKVRAIKRASEERRNPRKPMEARVCAHAHCRKSFETRKRLQIFCSKKCRHNAHYRRHRPRYLANRKRWIKENREKARAAVRRHHAKYREVVNAKTRQRYANRTTEALRLKNLEGLDIKTGLRLSLAAHRLAAGINPYQMAPDVYPDSSDPGNAIKQLVRRFQVVPDEEKQRIMKLEESQRKSEAQEIRARLHVELAKPQKKTEKI